MIDKDFYLPFLDVFFTYSVTLFILSIGLFISSMEDLRAWSIFKANGILSWEVSELNARYSIKRVLPQILNWLFQEKIFKLSIYARLLCSFILMMLLTLKIIFPPLILFLFFLEILMVVRSPYGINGAYQMNMVILLAMAVGTISGISSPISKVCLCFIAGELLLSYFISGVTKMGSPMWRGPLALNAIFSTRSFGHPLFYRFISQKACLATSLSWFIMIFEASFCVVLFLDPSYAVLLALVGISFHFFNAVFMGLNDFFLAFSAAYPALIFCISSLHSNF